MKSKSDQEIIVVKDSEIAGLKLEIENLKLNQKKIETKFIDMMKDNMNLKAECKKRLQDTTLTTINEEIISKKFNE
tara:strand:+ start:536 stop:763 length:228 start_codon:yes stop_codon:yes gene_type:complete